MRAAVAPGAARRRRLRAALPPVARLADVSFRHLLATIVLIAVGALHLAGVALAQVDLSSDTRRSLETDIERYERLLADRERELQEIAAALGDTSSELERRIAERDAVSAELAERRAERERVNAQIAELEGRLAETEARIAALDERLGELRLRVSELLVGLYKQQGNRMGSLLAQSRSFHELQVRNYYVGLLSQQDAAVIGELDSLLYALDMERQSLEQQRAELEAAEAQLAAVEAERHREPPAGHRRRAERDQGGPARAAAGPLDRAEPARAEPRRSQQPARGRDRAAAPGRGGEPRGRGPLRPGP